MTVTVCYFVKSIKSAFILVQCNNVTIRIIQEVITNKQLEGRRATVMWVPRHLVAEQLLYQSSDLVYFNSKERHKTLCCMASDTSVSIMAEH